MARSPSQLAATYAIGVLAPATLDVRDVSALTVSHVLPWTVVEDFQHLVDT